MFSFKKTDNYYLSGIKAIVFLIPLLPLYVSSPLAFPYITGKNFAFRIMVELAAALWAGLLVSDRRYRPRNSALTLSILTFTLVVGLADLLGVNPYKSFWSDYERMEGYITILHLVLYFMIAGSVLRSGREWNTFFGICITASLIAALFAFAAPPLSRETSQLAWEYGSRISGTLGNPPFLASYLLLSIFLGFILFFNTQRPSIKAFCLLAIIIDCIAIYFSSSRGATLAGIAGLITLAILYITGKRNMPLKRLFRIVFPSVAGILILVLVVFLLFRTSDFVRQDRTLSRFASALSDQSVKNRFTAWKMALNAVKERPVLGWGQENFISLYTVNSVPIVDNRRWLDHAHNIVVDWLVNAGILGLLSYLSIFGAAFYITWQAYQKKAVSRNVAFTIGTALAAYFVHNLFTFDTISTYLLFFGMLAYIDHIGNSGRPKDFNAPANPEKPGIKAAGAAIAALLVFSALFYYLNYKPARESSISIQAGRNFQKDKSFTRLLDSYDDALSLRTFGDADVRERMTIVSHMIMRNKFFEEEGALKFIKRTVEELEKGIALNRYDLKYLISVIDLYKEIALYEPSFIARTEGLIRQGISLNPEYQWFYMALADTLVMKKDFDGVLMNVKKIVDWDPKNDKKQIKLALAAIYASRQDIVKSSLENVKKIREANNEAIASGRETVFSAAELYQIASVYKVTKHLHKSLRYYREILTLLANKDNLHSMRDFRFRRPTARAGLHLEMAKIHLALGNNDEAVTEAGKAARLDPENFGAEAEEIIYTLNN